ncbi:TonB-dependent receptor plug domain-containing protein, partial [Methylosinus sp. H3A]|uniref:TonB-dependent receptor plug domain-containing protein n=1 Tax=Methylosinus sp. H3A TaxID=2785786 RepID=UPI00289E68C3
MTNGTGELSKRRLEVLNIPRPIVVVDPKTAERERLYRLEDFAEKVPNYQPKTGSAVTSRPSIRGVGSTLGPLARCNGNPAGSEFDTGFVLDNVSWKNPGFQNGDFSDIESFEIGHGPQGTAGGKNTTVGSIVIRTQPPSFERKATIETSFANNNRVIEKANVTGPIVENALAYRVAAYFDKGDGWIRDQVSGAGYLNNDRFGVRGQLLYVGEHVTNRLIFSFGEANENKNCSSYASGPFADSFQMFANGTTPARTYAQNVWFRLGKPILTFDPYRPYHAGARSVSDRHYTVSNELNWTIGENTLTSISAYGSSSVTSNNLHGINLLDTTSGVYHPYVEQLSQELRFASPKEQA